MEMKKGEGKIATETYARYCEYIREKNMSEVRDREGNGGRAGRKEENTNERRPGPYAASGK